MGGFLSQQLLFLAVVFLQVSCVTLKGGYTDSIPKSRAVFQKISVNFSNEVIILDKHGKARPGLEQPIVKGHFLVDSGFFLTTQSLPGEEDLHFSFQTVSYSDEYGFSGKKLLNGVYLGLSFLSATIIPYYYKDWRRLKVDVMKYGKVLKSYFYQSNNLLFSWLFALPFWRPSDSGDYWYERTEKTIDLDRYLVGRFLQDFHRDFMPKPTS